MEKVKVEDAVGMVLAHDLTKIVPPSLEEKPSLKGEGSFKGAAFKKGHVIRAEDIEELKNIGKNHLYVVQLTEGQVHENEAAYRVAAAAVGQFAVGVSEVGIAVSQGLVVAAPLEGKANIKSSCDGILKIDAELLLQINRLGEVALVTLHNHTVVKENQLVAAAKIIPLVIAGEKIAQAEEICRQRPAVIEIKPLYPLKTGIIVTGTEVYCGRIQDRFGEVLKKKIADYGGEFLDLQYAPDDLDMIGERIVTLDKMGAEIILISGGMAVDADDVSPQAIQKAATEVVTYGTPVLPGAMCMVAYRGEIPLVGIPACGMFNKTTVFDIIFPRLLAKEHLQRDDLISLGHGGMCLQCEECHYPACPFGK